MPLGAAQVLMKRFLAPLALLLLLAVACSEQVPPKKGGQGPPPSPAKAFHESAAGSSGAYGLALEPAEASRGTVLRLSAKGFDLGEASLRWLVDGAPVSAPEGPEFDTALMDVSRGSAVQAEATVGEDTVLSNQVSLLNAKPRLTHVKILPEVFTPGEDVHVEAQAEDPDGDMVDIEYEWTKNGAWAGRGEALSQPLKRGDAFSVRVIPFDGQQYGAPVVLTRKVQNMPPMLSEHKDFHFDGISYTYRAQAHDPDGDPVRFGLSGAPEGMSIDPVTGVVRWKVPPDFTGTATFTITASDGAGGAAEMPMSLRIPDDEGEAEAKPAPAS
jgi:hypothetical protein